MADNASTVLNVASHAVSIAPDGLSLPVGETTRCDPAHPENQAHVESGVLLVIPPQLEQLRDVAESLGIDHKGVKRDELVALIQKKTKEASS